MKPKFLTELKVEDIDGRFFNLISPFKYASQYLNLEIIIPKGFITDFESVPFIHSYSNRAGAIHDFLCRVDAIPSVTKYQACVVYLEAMKTKLYRSKRNLLYKIGKTIWIYAKYNVVKYIPFYWKKHKVFATYEDLK